MRYSECTYIGEYGLGLIARVPPCASVANSAEVQNSRDIRLCHAMCCGKRRGAAAKRNAFFDEVSLDGTLRNRISHRATHNGRWMGCFGRSQGYNEVRSWVSHMSRQCTIGRRTASARFLGIVTMLLCPENLLDSFSTRRIIPTSRFERNPAMGKKSSLSGSGVGWGKLLNFERTLSGRSLSRRLLK